MVRFLLLLSLVLAHLPVAAEYANRAGFPADEVMASPNFFDDLGKASATPEQVWYLDLGMRRPKLTTFPDEVYSMRNLKYLSLVFNRVASVGDGIAQLTELEELYLQGNHYLRNVSDQIGALKNLRVLHIADTGLSEQQIDRLRQLVPKNCRVVTRH